MLVITVIAQYTLIILVHAELQTSHFADGQDKLLERALKPWHRRDLQETMFGKGEKPIQLCGTSKRQIPYFAELPRQELPRLPYTSKQCSSFGNRVDRLLSQRFFAKFNLGDLFGIEKPIRARDIPKVLDTTVRPAEPADAPAILKLLTTTDAAQQMPLEFQRAKRLSTAEVKMWLPQDDGSSVGSVRLLVAEVMETSGFTNPIPRLIGCVRVYMPLEAADGNPESPACQAAIDMLAFFQYFRGIGVGTLLVKSAERFLLQAAIEDGFSSSQTMRIVVAGFREGNELLFAEAKQRSKPVRAFYSKRGYEPLQEPDKSIFFYAAGSPAIMLFKDVAVSLQGYE